MKRRTPRSTLFPDTTLFRSGVAAFARLHDVDVGLPELPARVAGRRVEERREILRLDRRRDRHRVRRRRRVVDALDVDRKSTRLNSSHANISYAVFCLTKKPASSIMTLASPGSWSVLRPYSRKPPPSALWLVLFLTTRTLFAPTCRPSPPVPVFPPVPQ